MLVENNTWAISKLRTPRPCLLSSCVKAARALRSGAVLLFVYANYANCSFVCLSPTRSCRALAWMARQQCWPQRCWATQTTGVQYVSSMWTTSHPCKIYAKGGGLVIAPKNASHLFIIIKAYATYKINKKYVLSKSESVQCNFFFIFDHVTFIQFKICCCVQNFIEIGWFFAEIWRYNNLHNGGPPQSWNCFTTRDHPRNLCWWPQLPVKFHVNLIQIPKDIAIWILRIFGLKCLFRPPKWVFLGDFGPLNVIIHHRDPQKAHPCLNSRLLTYQLLKSVEGSDL